MWFPASLALSPGEMPRSHGGFDHSHPVIRVGDIMGSQNESSILCKSGEHKSEINNIYPVLDQLVEDFILQIPFFLIRAAHKPYPPWKYR
jgi:hypothetical protein